MELAWQPEYASGLATIDQEHQNILRLFQELLEAIARGDSYMTLASLLSNCVAETEQHFQHEEQLAVTAGHPQCHCHRVAHQSLLRHLYRLLAQMEANPASLSVATVATTAQLVLHHICEVDLPMLRLLTPPEAPRQPQGAALMAENCF